MARVAVGTINKVTAVVAAVVMVVVVDLAAAEEVHLETVTNAVSRVTLRTNVQTRAAEAVANTVAVATAEVANTVAVAMVAVATAEVAMAEVATAEAIKKDWTPDTIRLQEQEKHTTNYFFTIFEIQHLYT